VLTIFLAGYETVANGLTWTWYLLSQNPEVEARLHAELDAVLGTGDAARLPTLADYPALRYTEQVFAESMRLYPPAWLIGRMSIKGFEMGGRHFPANSIFFVSPWIMHRDARFWGEPKEFVPERWMPPSPDRPRMVYIPFGGGPRVCIGERFAWMEGVLLLARIGPDAFSRLETRPPLGSPLAVPPDGRVSRLLDSALGDIAGHLGFLAEAEPGSNAWAVSGRRTTHGGAVLCNDSHRALDTPNVYWQCRVSCPGFDVAGATFPGLPGFPHFGFNGSVAWAITHGDADTQDLYIEQFDGSRYLTPDGWADASVREERILVRGDYEVPVTTWATRHGPVVHGDPADGTAITLKWVGTYRPNRGFECLLPMLTARSVEELASAQEGWVDPVNNLVCADTAGRIAYQCRGKCRCVRVRGDAGCPWRGGTGRANGPGPCRSLRCRGRSIPTRGS